MSELKVGEKAPDFSLVNQNSETVTLSRLKGKKVLVYLALKQTHPAVQNRPAASEIHRKT